MRSTMAGAVGEAAAAAHAGVGALVDAVSGEGGDLTGGQLRHASHDELSALLRETTALQARLEFVKLAAIREVDVRGSHTLDAALSTAAWARYQARLAPGAAAGAVRAARALGSGELPGTAAALADGQIHAAHARAIADAVDGAPAGAAALIEPEALAAAREADPRAVTALMRRFRHALDPDSADEAALARYQRRGLTLSPLLDGSVHIRGLADEVTGSVIATALDTASPPVTGDKRTPAQRRLDAIGEICRRYLGSPDAPMSGGGHPHVIVTLDSDTLHHPDHTGPAGAEPAGDDTAADDTAGPAAGAAWTDTIEDAVAQAEQCGLLHQDTTAEPEARWHRPGTDSSGGSAGSAGAGPGGTLSWVGPIAGSTARRVACDADVTMVIIDRHGRVTHEQQQRRFFTAAQRRAMIARDGDRCCVPFCDRPVAWSDGHHLQSWADGGPTSVANGALPCAGHHTQLHEGGWTLLRMPDGRYYIRDRDGRQVGPEPHPTGHRRPPPHKRN